jgi:hypothetical protein
LKFINLTRSTAREIKGRGKTDNGAREENSIRGAVTANFDFGDISFVHVCLPFIVLLQKFRGEVWEKVKKNSDTTADHTDLKLARYPRSLIATLAALPSVSLFP